nr:hypothetical protein HUO10_006151 [Paraburkholderia busanensis]
MFSPIDAAAANKVMVYLDGEPVYVHAHLSVAAARLLHSNKPMRLSPVNEQPRSAFCMIGNCYECLVEIDGHPNQQGCLINVTDQAERQNGRRGERSVGRRLHLAVEPRTVQNHH